jgi:hypothetical protein
MVRRFPLQIGKGERRLSIASIHRTEQGKESLVLVYGQKLTVTPRPALRGKVKAKNSNFT